MPRILFYIILRLEAAKSQKYFDSHTIHHDLQRTVAAKPRCRNYCLRTYVCCVLQQIKDLTLQIMTT